MATRSLYQHQSTRLAKWWAHLTSLPVFAAMRQSILDTWISAWDAGTLIAKEAEDPAYQWSFRSNGRRLLWLFWTIKSPHRRESKREDTFPQTTYATMDGENVLVDTRIPQKVTMHEGQVGAACCTRACGWPCSTFQRCTTGQSKGSSTSNASPTDCLEHGIESYYDERDTGTSSDGGLGVFVFDHTICTNRYDNPAKRVHATTRKHPHRRLLQVGRDGSLARPEQQRKAMWREIISICAFALINVWRSMTLIILSCRSPLAVCFYISEARGPLLYELQFLVA
jgi:hypothetical protein